MELNAVGDFSAGLFAPLAFLWLVVSLWMQRSEITQNTDVLKHQLEELRSTVSHQEDIAWATTAELLREKPYFYVEKSGLYYNSHDDQYELDIHFVNSGGPIREAKFNLTFPNYSDGFSLNEIFEGSKNFPIYIPTNKYTNIDFSTVLSASLTVDGIDIYREKFKHVAKIEIDFPTSRNLIDDKDDGAVVYTLPLKTENIFCSSGSEP